eukprot:5144606-Amphidinium_carterae.3
MEEGIGNHPCPCGSFGWHVDKNAYHTDIIGVGNYKHGELQVGDSVLDPRCKWKRFDGRCEHRTLPFTGQRWTIAVYTPCHVERLTKTHWRQLRFFGFPCKSLIPHDVVNVYAADEEEDDGRFYTFHEDGRLMIDENPEHLYADPAEAPTPGPRSTFVGRPPPMPPPSEVPEPSLGEGEDIGDEEAFQDLPGSKRCQAYAPSGRQSEGKGGGFPARRE